MRSHQFDRSSRSSTPAEEWSAGCLAWRLVDEPAVSIAEEEMAAGTQESWHLHDFATQYFYVLSGGIEVRVTGEVVSLAAREGALVRPGTLHQVANCSDMPATFLVLSAPPTKLDRRAATRPEDHVEDPSE